MEHKHGTSKGLRLPLGYWGKLALILSVHGKTWLLRQIDREHKKLTAE